MERMYHTYDTPIGALSVICSGNTIVGLTSGVVDSSLLVRQETPIIRRAGEQLAEYFAGRRQQFDLPLAPQGTPFQKKVWQALCQIPYGETRSYGQLAKIIGNEKACRAVGMANNRNPIMIFIPCHRVIGADGSLTGYAGGLDIKRQLLELEQHGIALKNGD